MSENVMKLDDESLNKLVEFFKLLAEIEGGDGNADCI